MEGWWGLPSASNDYQQLLPKWWQMLYPFTYYFLGAYLKEYPPKKRPFKYLILSLAVVLLWGLYNFYRSRGTSFVWEDHVEYFSYQALSVAFLVFVFFLSLDANRLFIPVRKFLSYLSSLTFGAYLVSWIFDTLSYPLLEQNVYYIPDRFKYYPLCIAFSAIGSLLLSAVIDLVWRALKTLCRMLKKFFWRTYEKKL
jgi:surface polysaccharide O-acyltransferase-like enzyme